MDEDTAPRWVEHPDSGRKTFDFDDWRLTVWDHSPDEIAILHDGSGADDVDADLGEDGLTVFGERSVGWGSLAIRVTIPLPILFALVDFWRTANDR